jgi:hypothetical protein
MGQSALMIWPSIRRVTIGSGFRGLTRFFLVVSQDYLVRRAVSSLMSFLGNQIHLQLAHFEWMTGLDTAGAEQQM